MKCVRKKICSGKSFASLSFIFNVKPSSVHYYHYHLNRLCHEGVSYTAFISFIANFQFARFFYGSERVFHQWHELNRKAKLHIRQLLCLYEKNGMSALAASACRHLHVIGLANFWEMMPYNRISYNKYVPFLDAAVFTSLHFGFQRKTQRREIYSLKGSS